MNTKEKVVGLIEQGLTVKEIQNTLGLKTPTLIYRYAKESGLKAANDYDRRLEIVSKMAAEGKHYDEIAQALGTDRKTITRYCNAHGIRATSKPVVKGIYKGEDAIATLAKHNPDWEYIGDYTGSDGYMTIRHICGYVTRKSCVTIRHHAARCEACEERAREQRERQRKRHIEAEQILSRISKPKMIKQTEMSECPVCGRFLFEKKFCSKECFRESERHRWSMKKRNRAKKAKTSESNSISLKKLYMRDKGTCWLCGGQCDYSANQNSQDYPSIDHIVPIACGGKDEWSNIKLAHRGCNSARGARIV